MLFVRVMCGGIATALTLTALTACAQAYAKPQPEKSKRLTQKDDCDDYPHWINPANPIYWYLFD